MKTSTAALAHRWDEYRESLAPQMVFDVKLRESSSDGL